jgi:rhamnosyltransferase
VNKIIAITVTYNPDLNEILQQLCAVPHEVCFVLVDNNSSNCGDIEHMIHNGPLAQKNICLLKNTENIGLAAAQNQGICQAIQQEATHILFFDQDSIPDLGMVHALVKEEESLLALNIQVGAVGPLTYDPVSQLDCPVTKYRGPFISRYQLSEKEVTSTSFIIASGSLIRTKVLKDVGLFDERFFIDYIDIEWCYRAQARGYQVFVTAKAKMSHCIGEKRVNFLGRGISQHSGLRRYYLARNSFFVLKMAHFPIGYKLREIVFGIIRAVSFFILSDDKKMYCRYFFKALHDGWMGRVGKIQP